MFIDFATSFAIAFIISGFATYGIIALWTQIQLRKMKKDSEKIINQQETDQ